MVLFAFGLAVTATIVGNLLFLKLAPVREQHFPQTPEP